MTPEEWQQDQDAERQKFCAEFTRLMDALGWDDWQMAKFMQISRPTVGRYRRGEAAMHPIGRPIVLQALEKALAEKLNA
jgi:predicted DNA-binding protein (UPF0251 family)